MKHLLTILAAVGFFVIAMCAGALVFTEQTIFANLGGEAREIEGTNLDGSMMRLSDYRGKVVLLGFWKDGGDSEEWRELLAYEKKLQDKFGGRTFVQLGVSADASFSAAKAAADRSGLNRRSWHDGPKGPIARAWDVDELPTFFLIDAEGHVRDRYDHFLIEEEMEWMVRKLVEEAKKK